MSARIPAFGVTLKAAATATPTVVIPGMKDLAFAGGDREMIEGTTHDNTVTKTYVPHPLRDVRSLSFTIVYDPADTVHERIRAAHAAGTLEYITAVLPDAGSAQWAMSGYYTKFTLPSMGTDGLLESQLEFMAVSAETFTQ